MRTTIILPDELMRQVRERARSEERTMTSFIEEALRRELASRAENRRTQVALAPATGRGGTLRGVDLTSNAAILDLLDEDVPFEKLR